jgi:hypothetical protein
MQNIPTPPSLDDINAYVANLCKAMENDLKEAEKHKTSSYKAEQAAKYPEYRYATELRDEVIRRASKHLPEAVAFYLGCWSGYISLIFEPCAEWERFVSLKLKVEAYIKEIS